MSRVIIKTAQGPIKIATIDGEKSICMCGLSKNQPYCDKSHLKTLDEKTDSLYQYDEAGKREELDVEDGGCEDCCGGCCEGETSDECCKSDDECCKSSCCESEKCCDGENCCDGKCEAEDCEDGCKDEKCCQPDSKKSKMSCACCEDESKPAKK